MLKVNVYDEGSIRVRFPARTWESAHTVIQRIREEPPDGYKIISARVTARNPRKGGRRCNVSIALDYCDNRVKPFTEDEAREFFREDYAEAQRVSTDPQGS